MLQRESRKTLSTIFSKYLIKCKDYFFKNFHPFSIVKNTISLQSHLFIEIRYESKISADITPFQEIRLNLLISTLLLITSLKLLINPSFFLFSDHLLISLAAYFLERFQANFSFNTLFWISSSFSLDLQLLLVNCFCLLTFSLLVNSPSAR